MSPPPLVILARTGDELLGGQAQNGVNFDFEVKFDLEGQDQSPPKYLPVYDAVVFSLWITRHALYNAVDSIDKWHLISY